MDFFTHETSFFSLFFKLIKTMSLPKLNFFDHQDKDLNTSTFDGAIILFTNKESLIDIIPSAKRWIELDATFGDSVQLILPEDRIPTQRIIISPTGSLHNDFDDVRRYKGKKGIKKEKDHENLMMCL